MRRKLKGANSDAYFCLNRRQILLVHEPGEEEESLWDFLCASSKNNNVEQLGRQTSNVVDAQDFPLYNIKNHSTAWCHPG
jgi:hypothetical protein